MRSPILDPRILRHSLLYSLRLVRHFTATRHIVVPRSSHRSPSSSASTSDHHRNHHTTTTTTTTTTNKQPRRVFAISDVHTDYVQNLEWVRALEARSYQHDILIVAGDVCDDLALLETTLALFTSKFHQVFYCPGNHELWIRSTSSTAITVTDSWSKLHSIFSLCRRLNVHTTPQCIDHSLWIVPLHSWHHHAFDPEPDVDPRYRIPRASVWSIADYAACTWPEGVFDASTDAHGSDTLALAFDQLNQNPKTTFDGAHIDTTTCDVISFSHFLPLIDLLPEKRYLYFPNLSKASGSVYLGRRVKALHPNIHVFGHSHFAWDAVIDGIRYIQAPLCSPMERKKRYHTIGFDALLSATGTEEGGRGVVGIACAYW